MNFTKQQLLSYIALVLILIVTNTGLAQPPGQPPQVVSPEVAADRHITFRVYAPHADSVRLSAGDIPGQGSGAILTKGDNGVWEATIGPIDPGAYRYTLNVNGVPTVDPRNPSVSESNNTVWSVVYVPGSDFMDTTNVPHGAVATITYYSSALSKFRRMHIYTPPGYEEGKGKYPVFYLLHGAGDSDDSWSSEGRAGFILDNLIAAKKAVPMIVVMPAGHTRGAGMGFSQPRPGSATPPDEFTQDFTTDIMPYVESHYRTINDRAHRAIAGLSMGGMQTLNIAIPHLKNFAYIGVFSSGLFGIVGQNRPGAPGASTPVAPTAQSFPWEEEHRAILDDAGLKPGVKLFWFGTGKDDFLLATSKATADMFKKHGFAVEFEESTGAHTWINWRNYLNGFAPRLFR
jgi:enterochelin esterase family protein